MASGSNWSRLPNSYARQFQVLANGAHRRVVVFGPGGSTDTVAVYAFETDPGPNGGRTVVRLPRLERVAVFSTTHLPFLSALDKVNTVVAVANLKWVRDEAVQQRIEADSIHEIATADGLDREQLLVSQAQALFDYPFGRASIGGANTGVTTIAVTEYLEEHPLGRAEWIRFFGILMNVPEKADSVFAAIERRYLTLRGMNAKLADRPRVFFGSAWQGQWHVPPGNSYMAQLIADAGGEYCYADHNAAGNIPLDLESVVNEARTAEHFGVVLAKGGRVGVEELAGGDKRIAALEAVHSGGFYLDSERSDVFGKALLEPDIMLMDLRDIFHRSGRGRREPVYCFPIAQ